MEVEEEIKLLSEYFDVPEDNIELESDSGNYGYGRIYLVDGDEYAVMSQFEAEAAVKADIEELIEDAGWCVNLPIEDYVDKDTFWDDMHEYNRSYAEDIEREGDSIYANRLVKECVDNFIIDEEELVENNLGSLDIPEDRKYEIFDKFVDDLDNGYSDSLTWYDMNFGLDELADLYKRGSINIDFDSLADDVISIDGRGSSLASYDGEEHDLGDGMFAYRLN